MRLADAWGTADEEWVVRLRRHLSHGQSRGVGEAVGVAYDELVEGELGIAERARRLRSGGGAPSRARARVLEGGGTLGVRGRLSVGAYVKSLFSPVESAIFAADDPLPALLELPLGAYVILKRHWIRLRRNANAGSDLDDCVSRVNGQENLT